MAKVQTNKKFLFFDNDYYPDEICAGLLDFGVKKSIEHMENKHKKELIFFGVVGDKKSSFSPQRVLKIYNDSFILVMPIFCKKTMKHIDNVYCISLSTDSYARYKLYIKQKKICFYCKRETRFLASDFKDFLEFTKDHVIPVFRNGRNHRKNIIGSCRGCNELKSHFNYNVFIDRYSPEILRNIHKYRSSKEFKIKTYREMIKIGKK